MHDMLKTGLRTVLVIALAMTLSTQSASLVAQSSQPSFICMVRPGSNLDSSNFVAAFPPSEQQVMLHRGISPQACTIGPKEFSVCQANFCHLDNDAPSFVQVQFELDYSASPHALCDMATVLTGKSP